VQIGGHHTYLFDKLFNEDLEVGMNIAFLIISPPLMLNYYYKSLFYVAKIGAWRSGLMIMHHCFLKKTIAHKPCKIKP
jgi:hypothetical protein